MAKVVSNQIIEGLSGSLGRDLMFRRLPDGRTVLCVKPDFSRRIFSAGQAEHQQRFRQAVAYAHSAAKAEPRYAEIAAGTRKTAYNLALSDWFHPPVVHSVEVREGRICVRASDKVCVAQVRVTVLDGRGEKLEDGQAVQLDKLRWEYTPVAQLQTGQRVLAEARDLPGNLATGEMVV